MAMRMERTGTDMGMETAKKKRNEKKRPKREKPQRAKGKEKRKEKRKEKSKRKSKSTSKTTSKSRSKSKKTEKTKKTFGKLNASKLRFFVAVLPGVEDLLATEVLELTGRAPTVLAGGVEMEGDDALYRVALGSAFGSHITLRTRALHARRFETLMRETRAVPWAGILAKNARVSVRARCRKSRLHHSGAVEERVLRAIGETHGEGTAGGPEVTIICRIFHDEVTLSLDMTGAPLFKRGYREATAKAPLREDLAQVLLSISGWQRETPLLDPFSGSGTIGIEAARLALGILPGGQRSFDFEGAPFFDRAGFKSARAELEKRFAERRTEPIIHCADRDEGAISALRANAERAGVADAIRVHHAALGKAPFFRDPGGVGGALVTNPPHGRRVGDPTTLKRLYQSLGARIRELPGGFTVALLVRDARSARAVGVNLESRLSTDQGGSKVRMLVGKTGNALKSKDPGEP
jgi:putative N6-adenine-specific DNA methylase